ncbi:wd repeat and sof domain-containing protein 1 [Gigaspora margarita]|uniref:Wd repeat and sof domain-containing protein 1 n=1 Tax=Gigaspora margarita TaxID=4874 RepID=A0A8H4AU33_GIGMA|nr:wd repeat and sof domain-containing protein 1 [Gigaspora margarita]
MSILLVKVIVFAIIIIIFYFSYIYLNVSVKNTDNVFYNESITVPPFQLNGRKRPKQGYIVRNDLLEKNCGDIKSIMVENCLKYLDDNEEDYMISFPTTAGVSPPPPCNRDHSPMLFHVFWKGQITDKIALMMKSFLYSQPLECSKLYVWLDNINDTNFNDNEHIRPLLKYSPTNIEFKEWNIVEQFSSSDIYAGWQNHDHSTITVALSDLVRFVVLHNYGGIYIDADVLLVRDMRPLYYANFEFSYRWSYLNEYNTAVLRLWKESQSSKMAIRGAINNNMSFHPWEIRKYLSIHENSTHRETNKFIYMFPPGLFDPLWLKRDNQQPSSVLSPNLRYLTDVFNPSIIPDEIPGLDPAIFDGSPLDIRYIENFFRGAFTYHWHNHWEVTIHPTSWIGVIQTAYDDFLSGKRRNLYNEYIFEQY